MQGVDEGESARTEQDSESDMDMQYDMAVCEEEGEEDAPRRTRSEEETDGSDGATIEPTGPRRSSSRSAGVCAGRRLAVPGETEGVKEGYEGRAEEG